MTTLQSIEAFITVVTERSFRAAAQRLATAQSVVSAHVRAFESWMGIPLLDPRRRSGALSLEGEEVYLIALRILQRQRNLENFLAEHATHGARQSPPASPTLKQLETLVWLHRLGTLERAAQKLNITPAAAARRVQELARQCDFELFDNPRRKSRFTPLGEKLLASAQRVLAAHAELDARRKQSTSAVTVLHLGVTELVALTWFPAFVRQMRAVYPHVSLHPDVDLAVSLRNKVARGQLDLAILPQAAPDERMATVDVGTVDFSWFCAPGTFEAGRKVSLYTLAEQPLLVQGRGSGITTVTEALFASAGLQPRQVFGSNSLVALAGLIESGIGIACLPNALFRNLVEASRLAIVKTSTPAPNATYCVAFLKEPRAALGYAVASVAKQACNFSL